MCVCVTLTRQWSPASLSSDLKEESWSGDREMEGFFLWTGMKTTVGHREGVQLADRGRQSEQQKANEWLR